MIDAGIAITKNVVSIAHCMPIDKLIELQVWK